MKHLYSDCFSLNDYWVISTAGDADNLALVNRLADEVLEAGIRPLVLSPELQKYPIEGKVLVSDETSLLLNLIRSEDPQITYLARQVKADMLVPFKAKEIVRLAEQLKTDNEGFKVFLLFGNQVDPPKAYSGLIKQGLPVCTVNFNRLREELLEVYRNTAIRSSNQARKKIKSRFLKMITENCPSFAEAKDKSRHVLYIDQVKNALDENLLIPVARHLQEDNPFRILYGSLHHYHIKEI